MVTMAKGIGNGAPLAAVITTPEIAACMKKSLHFNTYGGNPVSSAIGRAVLKVIDEEGIQENALHLGDRLKKGLAGLQQKHQIIGDVRGRGLMLGVELVKDRDTKEPATAECVEALERCKDMGLLIGKGLFGSVCVCVCVFVCLSIRARVCVVVCFVAILFGYTACFSFPLTLSFSITGGLFGNTFRIKPPMCLTEEDADFIVDAIDRSLEGL
jgi:alanine-glyoxylate transaminase / (R)-3-amino-2-methylpropionate-pyruvate transaminase